MVSSESQTLDPNAQIELTSVSGSSRGRGTRAAGWFADLIKQEQIEGVHSMILEGGIKGWAKGGDDFTAMMDEHDPKVWQ